MRRLSYGFLIAAACVCTLAPVAAQTGGARYALVVQGTSGGDPYTAMHRGWLTNLVGALKGPLGLDAAHLTVLAETPGPGELAASAENVKATLDRLSKQLKDGDLLFILLIGHGGGDGMDAKFNLVGPDLNVTEWAALLKPIAGRLAFVDTTGASFPFIKGLAAPGRVIITATASGGQKYDPVFAGAFIEGLAAKAADADHNARISLLEAFVYANRLVKQHYDQAGTLSVEKAVFDDTGEGIAREAAVPGGAIGTVAGLTFLDVPAAPTSNDPAVQELLVKQRTLTDQVDELRRKRPTMTPEAFDEAFEKLIIALAEVSRDVRRKIGG